MEKNQERLYKPNEVARMIDISTDLLRKWSDEFNIQVETTDGGHRRYTKENCEILVAISKKIKEQNWSWEQVRSWRNGEHDSFSSYEEKSNAEKKLEELLEYARVQKERADQQEQFNLALIQQLKAMEDRYNELNTYVQKRLPNREDFLERDRRLIELRDQQQVEKEVLDEHRKEEERQSERSWFHKMFGLNSTKKQ